MGHEEQISAEAQCVEGTTSIAVGQGAEAAGSNDADLCVEEARPLDIGEQIKLACPDLDPMTLDILTDMYGADRLHGTEGEEPFFIDKITRISIEQGAMLNELMRTNSVEKSLEIGLAFGFSTVWMLDALRSHDHSLHISLDPFQKSGWHGIGLAQAQRIVSNATYRWIEDYSIHALSDLIRQGEKFDFVYIDGNHRFDDVIVDFYLSDQIVRPGGLIVLDDMWMNSIQTATSFLVNNRSYEVVPTSVANITVLRKTRDDDREWTHFNEFEVYGFTPEPTPERPVADAFYPPHEAPPMTEASDFPVGEATTRQSWFTRLGRAFHGLA